MEGDTAFVADDVVHLPKPGIIFIYRGEDLLVVIGVGRTSPGKIWRRIEGGDLGTNGVNHRRGNHVIRKGSPLVGQAIRTQRSAAGVVDRDQVAGVVE